MNNYNAQQSMKGVFCSNLTQALKAQVKGEVKCHTVDESLIVDIYGANGTVFRYKHDNISSEIVHGFASEACATIIMKRYRGYIGISVTTRPAA